MHQFCGSRYIRYGYVAVPNCETNYVDRRLMLLRRKALESSAFNIWCLKERWTHRVALHCYGSSKVWIASLRFIATKCHSSTLASVAQHILRKRNFCFQLSARWLHFLSYRLHVSTGSWVWNDPHPGTC